MAIKIDLRVPPCKPVPEVTAFVQECEDAGFDGVGMLDSQMLERDVFVSMAHALLNTKTIKVASAVTNPVTRHPSVLASAAQTVSEIAPGRAQIWMGRGYSSANVVGIPPATVRQMRDATVMMKELMAGSEIDFGETSSRMKHGGGVTTPVYIAATGPRVMKVAGEVADGAVLMTGINPNAVSEARELIADGARSAGRNPDDIETIFTCTTIIRDDIKEAREIARPLAVQRLMEKTYVRWLKAAGMDFSEFELPRGLWELYPDVPHAEDWEKAKELCAFLPDDALAQLCDTMGLIGSPEYCAERIKQAEAAGLEHLYLMTDQTYEFAAGELAAFKNKIFPALGRSKHPA
ncbi:MAG: LLM class flavin-dependent oxidoreductase [SAR202 cluster bacterium]|nr:LLM class flavin-dependent oxidoreductase [SAR202 cluster bacterium]MQG78048.1 LLM class flavin-dependent oxidoreductase [SAR202 cluster bacterium]|tara:strand:- start:1456 stop:2502 length:1047 start_codon:yes stop_codon:yes gene_type:complete